VKGTGMKEEEISKQFFNRVHELAMKNSEEILDMVRDYLEIKKSFEIQTTFFERLNEYDDLLFALIGEMLDIRSEVRIAQLRTTKEMERKKRQDKKEGTG
jgi:hypothetical protein